MPIIYTAQFIKDKEDLLKKFPPKHDKVFAHHSTIAFKPRSLDGIEMGRESKMKIIARAWDEKGDTLLVDNPKSQNENPHITISCAKDVPPTYSNELLKNAVANHTLQYMDPPEEIEVIEGYFDGIRDVKS